MAAAPDAGGLLARGVLQCKERPSIGIACSSMRARLTEAYGMVQDLDIWDVGLQRRRVWPGLGETLLLALLALVLMLLVMRMRGYVLARVPLPAAAVTAPDTAHPYRLRAAPTIGRSTYRAALAAAQHPLVADADAVYDLLVAAGIDPAVQLALTLLSADLTPGLVRPPPTGGYNLHGLVAADGTPLRYRSYREAAAAWVVWLDTLAPWPDDPDAPLTLAGLVALHCGAPTCDSSAMYAALRRAVDGVRAQEAWGWR